MEISKNGLIELANYEALAHTKYIDSGGVQTIGIGMTVSEIKDIKSWAWDRALSTQECVEMYVKSIKKYQDAVNKALKVPIEQHQFDVLVFITYNIGVGIAPTKDRKGSGMAGSTFMERINAKDSPERIVSAMKAWNKDNGKVVKGLINRRNAEAKIFLTGQYTSDGRTVGLIVVNTIHKPVYKGRVSIEEYL